MLRGERLAPDGVILPYQVGEWSLQCKGPRIAASLVRVVHAAVATLQGAQG